MSASRFLRALCTFSISSAASACAYTAYTKREQFSSIWSDKFFAECKGSDIALGEQKPASAFEVLYKHVPADRLKQLQLNWKLDRITRFGLPYPVAGHLTIHPGWIGAYDCTRKNPLWVAHMVSASDFQKPASKDKPSRSNSQFYADPTLPVHLRAAPTDYTKSGYDRGHLIPAADLKHLSQDALDETFNMANVCPQVGAGFNRNYWARLEELTRKLVRDGDFAEALVCTGPLYLPQRRSDGRLFVEYECIGEGGRVAVPTHFFKIILAERTVPSSNNAPLHLAAFILPNGPIDENQSLAEFEFPLEAVESAAGLKFFPQLPSERSVVPLCQGNRCQLPPDFSANSKSNKKSKV